MYKITHLEPSNIGTYQEILAEYVMEQVEGMSFDEKDDFNEAAFIQTACKELGWATVPQTGGFEVSWEYSVQIDGASTTFDESELLKLATKHNVPDWLIYNFDDPNPVVFTYVWHDKLCGEHETKTPLIHLMNWIERESDGHYTFNS
jgi:hypothetical protein